MNCPSCAAPMLTLDLEGHGGAAVAIDACTTCQAFWFDRYESLQLAPASTLRLFTLIREHAATAKGPLATVVRCPRCAARLLKTNDLQRSTRFEYFRCDRGDGRFITFFNFLREKEFIRPLSPAQIAELRRSIQSVNCSNCGAPVDLSTGAACTHCGSPLAILDLKQAEAVVAQLQRAAEPKPVDPALALNLARARREVEAAFASVDGRGSWSTEFSAGGLVEAGLQALSRWLKPGT